MGIFLREMNMPMDRDHEDFLKRASGSDKIPELALSIYESVLTGWQRVSSGNPFSAHPELLIFVGVLANCITPKKHRWSPWELVPAGAKVVSHPEGRRRIEGTFSCKLTGPSDGFIRVFDFHDPQSVSDYRESDVSPVGWDLPSAPGEVPVIPVWVPPEPPAVESESGLESLDSVPDEIDSGEFVAEQYVKDFSEAPSGCRVFFTDIVTGQSFAGILKRRWMKGRRLQVDCSGEVKLVDPEDASWLKPERNPTQSATSA